MKNISDDLMEMRKRITDPCYGFLSTMEKHSRLAILEQLDEHPINVKQHASSLEQEPSMISYNLRPPLRCKLDYVCRGARSIRNRAETLGE